MTYILTKVGNNEAILEDVKGNRIKMIFSENDDYETEDKITHSLLTSYEQRMKGICDIAEYKQNVIISGNILKKDKYSI